MGFWEGLNSVVGSMAEAMNKAAEERVRQADRLEEEGRLGIDGYEARERAKNYMSKYSSYKSRSKRDDDDEW